MSGITITGNTEFQTTLAMWLSFIALNSTGSYEINSAPGSNLGSIGNLLACEASRPYLRFALASQLKLHLRHFSVLLGTGSVSKKRFHDVDDSYSLLSVSLASTNEPGVIGTTIDLT